MAQQAILNQKGDLLQRASTYGCALWSASVHCQQSRRLVVSRQTSYREHNCLFSCCDTPHAMPAKHRPTVMLQTLCINAEGCTSSAASHLPASQGPAVHVSLQQACLHVQPSQLAIDGASQQRRPAGSLHCCHTCVPAAGRPKHAAAPHAECCACSCRGSGAAGGGKLWYMSHPWGLLWQPSSC